jgi:hypothetical protein
VTKYISSWTIDIHLFFFLFCTQLIDAQLICLAFSFCWAQACVRSRWPGHRRGWSCIPPQLPLFRF